MRYKGVVYVVYCLKKMSHKMSHVIYVLDRSGSMDQFGDEGYTSVQAAISELPSIRGEDCLVSIFAFDHEHVQVADSVLARDFVLDRASIAPRGMTALRDALKTALEFMDTLSGELYLVVFTDGDDNMSKTLPSTLSAMLRGVRVSWLAAGEADLATANSLGIDSGSVLKVGVNAGNMSQALRSSSLRSDEGFTQEMRVLSMRT